MTDHERLEKLADRLSYVAEQDPHYSAEDGLDAGAIRGVLADLQSMILERDQLLEVQKGLEVRAEKAEAEVERLLGALRDWDASDSAVDCEACATLEAELIESQKPGTPEGDK